MIKPIIGMITKFGKTRAWLVFSICASLSTNIVNAGGMAQRIAAGTNYTIAIKPDNSVWAWGGGPLKNYSNAFPKEIGTGYIAISAGGEYPFGIKSDNSLWAFNNILNPVQIGTGYMTISAGSGRSIINHNPLAKFL